MRSLPYHGCVKAEQRTPCLLQHARTRFRRAWFSYLQKRIGLRKVLLYHVEKYWKCFSN